MARALSIWLVLLCCGGVAYGDKSRIAVLGLEVAPGPGGSIDPGAVLIAKEVTRELRQRVAAPTSPYVMAPNSSKELVDEKLLMSCDSEAPDCMVLIGAGLASDALLYGRVEKRSEGFRISLKLLDVKRKQIQPAVDDLIGGGGVAACVRRLYRKLIGDGPSNEGSVVIRARSDAGGAMRGGAVIVDDQVRGTLSNGKLAVTGVAEGRHTVAIAVGGFHRFEEIVNVRGGEQTTIDAVLHTAPPGEPMPGVAAPAASGPAPLPAMPPPEGRAGRPSPLWKVSLAVGAAGVVAGGVYAWYSYDHQQAQAAHVQTGAAIDSGRCDDSDATLLAVPGVDGGVLHAFRRACSWHTQTFVGYTIAGLGAATALVSLIMMSRDPGPGEGAAARAHRQRSELAIAPLVGPGVAGAQLGLSW